MFGLELSSCDSATDANNVLIIKHTNKAHLNLSDRYLPEYNIQIVYGGGHFAPRIRYYSMNPDTKTE